ncbi:MAG: histone deacetylase family protein [Desulforhopalus sp.]
MKKTAIFRHTIFQEHDPGFGHPDSPERLKTLYSALEGLSDKTMFVEPEFSPVSRRTLLLNHTPSMIDKVAATAGKMYSVLDADTSTSKNSYEAACLAVGGCIKGVQLLHEGKIDNGMALVRPPGHHAEPDKPMGYCLFNNVALAARYAVHNLRAKRVMIVDWDVHHGNGTQKSFYATDEVLYISIHQSPHYPGTGSHLETGEGKGEGFTLNIPLPGGQGDSEYANIFNSLIIPLGKLYMPELILVSAGFDSCEGDTVSAMRLSHLGFGYMTRSLVDLAKDVCGGKILISLEGGYDLNGLKKGVFTVLSELAASRLDTPFTSFLDEKNYQLLHDEQSLHPAIERVREVAKNYWKL